MKGQHLAAVVALMCLLSLSVSQAVCSDGQYSLGDSCGTCPSTCTKCANAQFCRQCKDTYFLMSRQFSVTCQNCAQIFPGCVSCQSVVSCLQCGIGYYLENGTCFACSNSIDNCVRCTNNGQRCDQCQFPYLVVNNTCVSQVIDQIVQPVTTDNSAGQEGSPNTTTGQEGWVTLPNGTRQPPVLDVYGCNQVQVYYFDRCINKIPKCVLYQPSGLCSYCQPSYQVTLYGSCTPRGRFLRCEPGFWLNREEDRCQAVSRKCDWYYPDTGRCKNCSTGYKFEEGECVQAINCTSQQFFFEGTCVDVPRQCVRWDQADGTCFECILGWTLVGGLCTFNPNVVRINPCQFPCKTCNPYDRTFCFSCERYYHLQNGRYGVCAVFL